MADTQKFYFDVYPQRYFGCVAAGTFSNAYDNVRVTVEIAREIDAFFAAMAVTSHPALGGQEDLPITDMPVGPDGLIDLGDGYSTCSCRSLQGHRH